MILTDKNDDEICTGHNILSYTLPCLSTIMCESTFPFEEIFYFSKINFQRGWGIGKPLWP